jgi:IS5 family transposase
MRVGTAVVETNIHHPTDGGLLGDGARVVTRTHEEGREGYEWVEEADL